MNALEQQILKDYGTVKGWVMLHPWLSGLCAVAISNIIGVIFRV